MVGVGVGCVPLVARHWGVLGVLLRKLPSEAN